MTSNGKRVDVETRLRQRLEALRAEFEKGKQTIDELEAQASKVRTTLLRISGAIQVLQEELEGDAANGANEAGDASAAQPERGAGVQPTFQA